MALRSTAAKRKRAKKPVRDEIRSLARGVYRQAILDAAERVFARLGYHNAKMTDVAAQAGVSIGTLYNHFGSKELIFSSLVERGTEQIAAALELAAKTPDPGERLREIVTTALSFLEQRADLFAVYRQFGAFSESDLARVGGKYAEESYVAGLELLTRTIEENVEHGRIRSDVPSRMLAAALSGGVNAAVFEWVLGGNSKSLKDRAEVILEIFMQGAKAQCRPTRAQ